jgi:hypothetical protein
MDLPAVSFGDPSHYYAQSGANRPAPGAHERMLADLLLDYDSTVRLRVERARLQWEPAVRELLRVVTGLDLTIDEVGNDSAVPVRLVDGLSPPFARIAQQFDEPAMWRLLMHKLLVQRSIAGLEFATRFIPELMDDPSVDPRTECMAPALEMMRDLLVFLEHIPLEKRLSAIDEDYLGAYFFRVPEVQLNWMPIGVMSAALDLSVEALTVVVIAHTLAHACAHLGQDSAGDRWLDFPNADLALVEAIAQFCAAWVCAQLRGQFPEVAQAFDSLLSHQPDVFRGYQIWGAGEGRTSEMRLALAYCRHNAVLRWDDFPLGPVWGHGKTGQSGQ